MPTIRIQNMPLGLYGRLRDEAAKHHRSIEEQAIRQLELSFQMNETDMWQWDSEEARAQRAAKQEKLFAEIAARPYDPIAKGAPDVVDVIREMREERTNQIMEACGFRE